MIRVKIHDQDGVRFGWLGNDLQDRLCYVVITDTRVLEIVPYQFITIIYTEE